jgi:hypothetical protein
LYTEVTEVTELSEVCTVNILCINALFIQIYKSYLDESEIIFPTRKLVADGLERSRGRDRYI